MADVIGAGSAGPSPARAGPAGAARYQLTATVTRPLDTEPRAAKLDRAKSTTRPDTNGPRETTLHVTDTPNELVTVINVPMGASLLAQVPAAMSSQLATPWVARPAGAGRATTAGAERAAGATAGAVGAFAVAAGPPVGPATAPAAAGVAPAAVAAGAGEVAAGTEAPAGLCTLAARTPEATSWDCEAAEKAALAIRSEASPSALPPSEESLGSAVERAGPTRRRLPPSLPVTRDRAGTTAKLLHRPRIMNPRSRLPSRITVRRVSPFRRGKAGMSNSLLLYVPLSERANLTRT